MYKYRGTIGTAIGEHYMYSFTISHRKRKICPIVCLLYHCTKNYCYWLIVRRGGGRADKLYKLVQFGVYNSLLFVSKPELIIIKAFTVRGQLSM